MFSLTTTAVLPLNASSLILDDSAGGVCTFEGRVRNHNDGKSVQRLEYEAYEPLALKEGARIVTEAVERFGILKAAAVHRTGMLPIGEIAVWVGASAAHRDEAFLACRFIIDEIKHRLPIWKKEHYVDGVVQWVLCNHAGGRRAAVHR